MLNPSYTIVKYPSNTTSQKMSSSIEYVLSEMKKDITEAKGDVKTILSILKGQSYKDFQDHVVAYIMWTSSCTEIYEIPKGGYTEEYFSENLGKVLKCLNEEHPSHEFKEVEGKPFCVSIVRK